MDRPFIDDREDWRRQLRGNPLPWLLHPDSPAVRHVDGEGLVSEIVRMLGGSDGDKAAHRHARELLKAA